MRNAVARVLVYTGLLAVLLVVLVDLEMISSTGDRLWSWVGWSPLLTATDNWPEVDAALMRNLTVVITAPAVALVLVTWLFAALRSFGFCAVDEEREAQARLGWNASSLSSLVRSDEVIARPVSKYAGRGHVWKLRLSRSLPAPVFPYWLQAARTDLVPSTENTTLRAFMLRPRTFATLPQLLVGILPLPLTATTVHATMTLAINAVCCGGYPPAEWLNAQEGSAVGMIGAGTPVLSSYAAAVVASLIGVRIIWPGGRANLAVSAMWAFFPVLTNLASPLFGVLGGNIFIFNPQFWTRYAALFWPGPFSLHWFFLALFAFDAYVYYVAQRNHLLVTDGRTTSLLAGQLSHRSWEVVGTFNQPPPVLRMVSRPLGTELTLRFGERIVSCSVHSLQQARELIALLGAPPPPRTTRRFFVVEFLTRCAWMVPIYVWLAWAYVNVVHTHLVTGALNFRVVRILTGYDVGPVADALKRETDFALEVQPYNDVARYYRARLLEDEGKVDEAATMYQQIARVPWKTLREARAVSPSPWWLPIRGQKIRNACNERLMKMGARQ